MIDDWEEEEAALLAQYQEPQPEINPHLAYTQGPAGQLVCDWKAFGVGYTSDQLVPRSTAPDRRFNVDPVEFYAQVCVDEGRTGLPGMVIEAVNGKVTQLELFAR